MSSQKKSSRLEGKDLITIGIYTVIYGGMFVCSPYGKRANKRKLSIGRIRK